MTGRVPVDGVMVTLFVAAALFLATRGWLADHPQHDPWAPLDLNDPPGWTTQRKLAALRSDPAECRAVLERSGVAFTALPPAEHREQAVRRPEPCGLHGGRRPPPPAGAP